jgi:ABC-2 type transport system ATP-binding protein
MSVKVENLTKFFGEQKAVADVSFEAKRGEVLGFLGPNGAGKSTTMKIICCFIPPSSGRVSVCGLDALEDSIEVRRRIGYLPENNPLYKEMYVREYLAFVAGVHRISRPRQRIDEMIERTGLSRECHKLIGSLSKGYRQRVGLAQAMLHDPEVLILDEPTSGLDPNQLVEIRNLIRQLGREKTVIFSTHIMQEVEAICDRVAIINRGQLVANDSIERLQERVRGEQAVTVEFGQAVRADLLAKIPGVKRVEPFGKNRWRLTTTTNRDIREEVSHFAAENKLTLLELHREVSTVEDVFQMLTKQN